MGEIMLKKFFSSLGLMTLFVLSFFYTDKVVSIVREQDPLMIAIKEYKESLDIKPVSAIIDGDSIIPGINGCKVDEIASYQNMNPIGKFRANEMEYIEVVPKLSLKNIYNKYIVKGNRSSISIIIKVNDLYNVDSILSLLSRNNVKASFFLDGEYIESNPKDLYDIIKEGHEIYNDGYQGEYQEEYIEWTNQIINQISKNTSNFCLAPKEEEDTLEICSNYKMHTIKPTKVLNFHTRFIDFNKTIEKGDILLFDNNDRTIEELNTTIHYLTKKGYTFEVLSKQLSEKRC